MLSDTGISLGGMYSHPRWCGPAMHPCGPAMLGVTHTVPWDTLASGFFRTGASTLVVRGCSGADGRGHKGLADCLAATPRYLGARSKDVRADPLLPGVLPPHPPTVCTCQNTAYDPPCSPGGRQRRAGCCAHITPWSSRGSRGAQPSCYLSNPTGGWMRFPYPVGGCFM